MAFGFVCFELDGITQQNIAAMGTPCFVRELTPPIAPAGGARCFFQVPPGAPESYASTTLTRAALVAGLVGSSVEFLPVTFSENGIAPAPLVTVNGAGEIASLSPLAADQLAPGVVAATRIVFSGGLYCDVQGTIATVAAALDAGGAGAAGVVGPQANVYVEPPAPLGRGNDGSGVRGDASRPFATLTAALAAMQSGDVLRLAAGTYAPPSAPIPAALLSGSIIGQGEGNTTIAAAAPGAVLDFGGAGARVLWTLANLALQAQAGSNALVADGTAAPAAQFFSGALLLEQVTISGGNVALTFLGSVIASGLTFANGALLRVATCGSSSFLGLGVFAPIETQLHGDWDNAKNPRGVGNRCDPTRFDGACLYQAGSGRRVVLSGQGGIFSAPGSVLPELTANLLTQSVIGLFTSEIRVGGLVEKIDFASVAAKQLPAAAYVITLQGARFEGDVQIAHAGAQAANTSRVFANGAAFLEFLAVGQGVRMLATGAAFSRPPRLAITTPGNGEIAPPTFGVAPIAATANTTVFAIPFRLPNTEFAVTLDAGAVTVLPTATTVKTVTGFTVANAAVPAGQLGAVVTYFGNP